MSVTLLHPVREATKIGAEHGKASASWVEINSDDDARKAIELDDDCELLDYLSPSAPLSGEFTDGYSERELLSDCDVSDEVADWSDANELITYRDRLSEAYENAYFSAYTEEVVSRAVAYLS